MNQIANTPTTKTMTSIELVEVINAARKAGSKELLHKNFMAKIEKHPGIDAAKFLASYPDTLGRPVKCYHLPEREAKLMVMSESLEVQTKVYDRMTALEAVKPPVSTAPVVRDTRTAALIEALIRQDALEQEQQRQSAELARIQENVAVIEARTQPENKHFTVLGYANLVGKKIDFATASRLGRKCAELSRTQGMVIGDVSDPRFGKVHSYHETILQVVLDSAALA